MSTVSARICGLITSSVSAGVWREYCRRFSIFMQCLWQGFLFEVEFWAILIFVVVSILILHLKLWGCLSLKDKRGQIKPILTRLQREFNLSTAEVGLQDEWQETILACAIVSTDKVHNQQVLQQVVDYTARHWPEAEILKHTIEIW